MMRPAIVVGFWFAMLPGAAVSAGESALARLDSGRASEQAAAMNEIVAAGEKSIPAIEAGYAKLAEDRRDLRERYRDAAARIRTGQVKAWVLETAPALDKTLAWDLVQRNLVWLPKPATLADARRALCQVSRSDANWTESEAVKVLALCLQDPAPFVREAAVWALDRGGWNGPGLSPERIGLDQKLFLVRVPVLPPPSVK